MTINNQHRLLLQVGAIVAVVICAKLFVHFSGWEVISINPLFSGIIAANVFLMGFLTTVLLCIGLILARIEPIHESLFFVGVISYLMIFLLMLIRDLDNPFGYYERYSGADVSLKPIQDTTRRLAQIAAREGSAPAAGA